MDTFGVASGIALAFGVGGPREWHDVVLAYVDEHPDNTADDVRDAIERWWADEQRGEHVPARGPGGFDPADVFRAAAGYKRARCMVGLLHAATAGARHALTRQVLADGDSIVGVVLNEGGPVDLTPERDAPAELDRMGEWLCAPKRGDGCVVCGVDATCDCIPDESHGDGLDSWDDNPRDEVE